MYRIFTTPIPCHVIVYAHSECYKTAYAKKYNDWSGIDTSVHLFCISSHFIPNFIH